MFWFALRAYAAPHTLIDLVSEARQHLATVKEVQAIASGTHLCLLRSQSVLAGCPCTAFFTLTHSLSLRVRVCTCAHSLALAPCTRVCLYVRFAGGTGRELLGVEWRSVDFCRLHRMNEWWCRSFRRVLMSEWCAVHFDVYFFARVFCCLKAVYSGTRIASTRF